MVITRVIIGSHIPVELPDAEVGNIFQVRLNKMITNIAAKKPGKEPETNEKDSDKTVQPFIFSRLLQLFPKEWK